MFINDILIHTLSLYMAMGHNTFLTELVFN